MSTRVDASSDGMQVNTDNMYEVGEPFRFLPSARSLILAVGYAFVVASMFLVVVCGTVESTGWGDGHPDVHPARLLGAATVLITLFVGYLASDRFTAFGYRKTNLAGTAIAAVDLAVMAVVELLFGLYPIVEGVTSALFGFAVALVLISGGRLLREVPKNEILQTQASIYCMTGLLFIVAMLSTDVVKLFFCLVYVLLGCACYFVFVRGLGTAALPDRKMSVERLQFDWRSSFSYAITGLAIGIACVILRWTLGDDVASSVFGLGFIAASVVSVFISKVKGASWVLLGPVERWTFPFIVCVQLMIIATGFTSVVSIVLSVALYCVLMVRDISRAVTRQVLAAEYDVQSVYLYTRATLPVIGGIAVGVTAGTFLAVFEVQSYVTWVLYVLVALFSVAVAAPRATTAPPGERSDTRSSSPGRETRTATVTSPASGLASTSSSSMRFSGARSHHTSCQMPLCAVYQMVPHWRSCLPRGCGSVSLGSRTQRKSSFFSPGASRSVTSNENGR